MKQKVKRKLALLVISALFIGLLPMKNQTVSKAEQTDQGSLELDNPRMDSDGTVTWDCVYFGNYWQEDTDGNGTADQEDEKQPIKWRVLSVDGDDAFLLADQNLDIGVYNDNKMGRGAKWETSTLRSWLNGYGTEANEEGIDYSGSGFLDAAFTLEEKRAIYTSYVVNDDNPIFDAEGGNDTTDQIYLLSIEEAMTPAYGFILKTNQTQTREAKATDYAIGKGASVAASPAGNSTWWLRSPGENNIRAALVKENGHVGRGGSYVYGTNLGVRPVLHLNLKVSSDGTSTPVWSYAGTVSAQGKKTAPISPVPTQKATVPPVLSTAVASDRPNISPTAEASEKPDVTASPAPMRSEKPEVTGSPSPVVSEEPEVTASPAPMRSERPGVTGSPMAREKPEGTESPIPVASEKPEKTAGPIPAESEKPEETTGPTPAESEKPEETAGRIPVMSEKPETTASPTPEESKKPNETASTSPTQVPENPTKPIVPDAVDDKKQTSPSVGTVLGDSKNKVSYKVSSQNKTVAFYKAKNAAATKVVIPATVTLDGVTYKVNAISDQAFKGCRKLKSVTIGKNITKIGKKAFYGCSKLKTITIKSKKLKKNSTGAKAFNGIHGKAVIKVPKTQKKTYQKWLRKKGAAKTVKIK